MEAAGGLIQWTPPPGMTPGFWWAVTDCTQAERIDPAPYFLDPYGWSAADLPESHETFPGMTSTRAARLRTLSPLVGVWGASTGFDFAQLPPGDGRPVWPPPQPYVPAPPQPGQPCRQGSDRDYPGGPVDLGAYAGVTFWAMAGDAGTRTLRVQLNDVHTDPRGGICNAADAADEVDCYNAFGVEVRLTSTPTQYRIAFSDLRQGRWGYQVPSGVPDWQRVYSMAFQVSPCAAPNMMCAGGSSQLSFDVWIDDLYFVNK